MEKIFGTWRIAVEHVPPTRLKVAAMYNQAAPTWQQSIQRLGFDHAYDQLAARLSTRGPLAMLPANARVLDCGIGTGALSVALIRALGTDLRLYGVDISSAMLHEAHRTLAAHGVVPNLECHDVYHLPYEANTFDGVVTAHMLEHVDDPLRALKAMTQVLRPGAPLLVVMSRRSVLSLLVQLRWRNTTSTPRILADWMTQAGLTKVDVYTLVGSRPWCQQMSFGCLGMKGC